MKTAQSNPAEAAGRTSEGPRSLTRILALFDLLARCKRHMSLSELSIAIDCPKSSLLVLLRPLTEKGYLMREEDNYFLGPRIFQFAQSILTNHPFESVLRGVMNDVVHQTGETILFAVRDGEKVIYSSVIESPQPVRYVAQQGINRPLFCSASGLVMLAFDILGARQWEIDTPSRAQNNMYKNTINYPSRMSMKAYLKYEWMYQLRQIIRKHPDTNFHFINRKEYIEGNTFLRWYFDQPNIKTGTYADLRRWVDGRRDDIKWMKL